MHFLKKHALFCPQLILYFLRFCLGKAFLTVYDFLHLTVLVTSIAVLGGIVKKILEILYKCKYTPPINRELYGIRDLLFRDDRGMFGEVW